MPPRSSNVSTIITLVHPLYSLYHHFSKNVHPLSKVPNELIHSNLEFVLHVWTLRLAHAAKNPNTIVVVVRYDPRTDTEELGLELPKTPEFARSAAWIDRRFEKFYREIQSKFGRRAFVVTNSIEPISLRHEITARGFQLTPRWKGEVFGEYMNRCVTAARDVMESNLMETRRHPRGWRNSVNHELTLFSLYETPTIDSMGRMSNDLIAHHQDVREMGRRTIALRKRIDRVISSTKRPRKNK